jgi:hypothetical protein
MGVCRGKHFFEAPVWIRIGLPHIMLAHQELINTPPREILNWYFLLSLFMFWGIKLRECFLTIIGAFYAPFFYLKKLLHFIKEIVY